MNQISKRKPCRRVSVAILLTVGLLACGRQGFEPQETPCDSVACSGHGNCVLIEGQAVCVCEDGYLPEGLECVEENIENPCLGVTCSGYGTCAVRDEEPWCVCAEGYHNEGRTNCVADERPCEGADGTECDDGQFCTVNDVCLGGTCMGVANDCDDSNSCTVDTCNEVDDMCVNTAAPDDMPCDDMQYCTLGEFCTAGVCGDGFARNCSDGNPCTADVCDADAGACTNTAMDDGTVCDDGAYCTVGESCSAGICTGGSSVDCSDANACTSDVCDESIDACANPPLVDGTPCEDGAFCTLDDVCSAGSCVGGGARDCSDSDQCTADGCDDTLDECVHNNMPDGTVCTDGQFCTIGETCTNGSCSGGAGRDCGDGNPCTVDSCNDTNDTCDHVDESDGALCDDGMYCTLTDVCSGGVCTGSLRDCGDGNGCTLDSCDDDIDDCVNDPVGMDGAGCDDGDFCTVADTCNGGSCSGSLNPCDDGNACTADSCDDVAGQCNNLPVGNGIGCDDGEYCTVGDICTDGTCAGTARDCSDASVCTADSCNEVSDECANMPVADGTACDDGAYCTVAETCVGGACGGGNPRNCSDGNQCTDDSCDDGNDACVNANSAGGTICDDGAYCTVGETCTAGACGGGSSLDCTDGNECTTDVCNETSDDCDHPAVVDGTPCADGEFCTINDNCSGGVCGGAANPCDDGNACTNDVCDEIGDGCVSTPVTDGTPCDDQAWCTIGETCTTGVCGGGIARSCSDGNPCTTDTCDDGNDSCTNTPSGDGSVCDDGAYCSQGETCNGGVCGGGSPRDCSDGEVCTADICDESIDECINDGPSANGNACDDGLYCTQNDVCSSGTCAGGNLRNCSDGIFCTVDSCDDGNNECVNDAGAANGLACDDGAFCTVDEVCSGGACGGGAGRNCSDGNGCTADSCDEVGDQCVNDAAAANGNACNDGLFCNVGETCSNGICQSGGPRDCSDPNQCTVDSCDEGGDQCVNDAAAANGNVCDDGQFCNVGETCLGGACQGGGPNGCSDGNPCTADSCDEVGDQCVNDTVAADGNPCSDGAYCTVGETCSGGLCTGGSARDCTDADACTADSCNEVSNQCVNIPVTDGTACNDGLYCNVAEICTGGVCGGGMARNCSDGNQCTADSCDDGNDQCVNDAAGADGAACDDGLFCMVGETCNSGVCGNGSPRDCSDPNQCTVDSCNEAGDTCVNDTAAMNGVPCDDGNFCLVGELCNAGVCGGGSVRLCDDGNSCTENNCNEGTDQCDNPDRPDGFACEAGQFCTSGDTCQSGICQEGAVDPCSGDPCANLCDEINDLCGGCAPAGTQCLNPVQEATCDGACNTLQLIICEYGCNLTREECNECAPSTTECKGDAEFLCNAEFVCDADGLLQSKTCCTTNRCSCDGSMCLEDLCATAPDLSAGGNLAGDTCNDDDHIPGDCNPGGSACLAVASGGAPEELFRFTLDDGTGDSAFFDVTLDSSLSVLDTTLRTSTICGNETRQVPYADVCGAPGTTPEQACSEEIGPEFMELCGLPEGTYYGAVDSPAGDCGLYDLDVTISQVSLETGAEAGNISMGGSFSGNTCGMADDYSFPDSIGWSGGPCGDCIGNNPTACPDCGVNAANDCTLAPNSTDDKCTYSGDGSPDAVFYLALDMDSGVDISTNGSDFDTVLYIMETGPGGASPPGARRVCNDDCWETDGASHIQTSLSEGLYYIYLDGAGGACGNYILRVVISPASTCGNLVCETPYEDCANCPQDCICPNCGDGVIDEIDGEQCDDNDTDDGDCCSAVCVIEAGCACNGEPSICGIPFTADGNSSPSTAIPDCSAVPPGSACDTSDYGTLIDTINIGPACTLVDINVDIDITHPYRGDISLELTSPGSTTVQLKLQNPGDSDNDIVGNYEQTLVVDGPGSLSDFLGEAGNGTWTLVAHDWYSTDTGTLNSWAVHLDCL
jgi:subtilisin-like proprotein convertase family protein